MGVSFYLVPKQLESLEALFDGRDTLTDDSISVKWFKEVYGQCMITSEVKC